MKNFLFIFFLLLSLLFGYQVLRILINDFSRLTDYGFGYLAGKVVLFLAGLVAAFLMGKKILRSRG